LVDSEKVFEPVRDKCNVSDSKLFVRVGLIVLESDSGWESDFVGLLVVEPVCDAVRG
jgi:hypothetical protein